MRWLKYFFASFFLQYFWGIALSVLAVLMYLIAHVVTLARFGLPVGPLGESKEGGTDSVSGATITFSGIAKALAEGSRYVKDELGR